MSDASLVRVILCTIYPYLTHTHTHTKHLVCLHFTLLMFGKKFKKKTQTKKQTSARHNRAFQAYSGMSIKVKSQPSLSSNIGCWVQSKYKI